MNNVCICMSTIYIYIFAYMKKYSVCVSLYVSEH